MNILGLIPARGGSQGIPRKNVRLLGGLPLIAHTIQAALTSRVLTRIVVSTDDPEIAAVARHYGAAVPFLRPAKWAKDHSPAIDVVRHALIALAEQEGAAAFDAVLLLQPTSPLRPAARMDQAADLMQQTGADTVVSVIEVPHHCHPLSIMRLDQERLVPYLPGPTVMRRQDKPPVYARNGPAVLLTRTHVIENLQSLYGNDVRPLVMSAAESVDIDTPEDWEVAEWQFHRLRRGSQSAA